MKKAISFALMFVAVPALVGCNSTQTKDTYIINVQVYFDDEHNNYR